MAYCVRCGAKVNDGTRVCPQCGAEIPGAGGTYNSYNSSGQNYQGYQQYDSRYNSGEYFDYNDVRQNKLMGVLSYLGILVFVPVFAGNKVSEYVRFHANQGLVLFIASAVISLLSGGRVFGIHSFINFGHTQFGWIFNLCQFVLFIFGIIGIVHACKGERKELPLIGSIRIIKDSGMR